MSKIHRLVVALGAVTLLSMATAKADDIVSVLAKNEKFKTLSAAIKAAGLEDALKGPGPFTIFAPTDEAFGNVAKKKLDDWMKPENKDKLAAVLKYHVIAGKVTVADALKMGGGEQTTLQGEKVTIKTYKKGTVHYGSAKIMQPDIAADNGVIHGISKVLTPPSMKATKAAGTPKPKKTKPATTTMPTATKPITTTTPTK